MPVNYLPLITTPALCLLPIVGYLFARMKGALSGLALALLVYCSILVAFAMPYWSMTGSAQQGNARAMYELARWYEWYCWDVQQWILAPCLVDRRIGFDWLVRASESHYAPAMYALGVRIKYDIDVPRDHAVRSMDGQQLIDRAVAQGQVPHVPEQLHYIQEYRR